MPSFTPNEERMIRAVAGFYAGLLEALREPKLNDLDENHLAEILTRGLEPIRPAARDLAAAFRALPSERRHAIHQEVLHRYGPQMAPLLESAGTWAQRFRSPEEGPKLRRVTERVLRTWSDDQALWVAGGFGAEAEAWVEAWAAGREQSDTSVDSGSDHAPIAPTSPTARSPGAAPQASG